MKLIFFLIVYILLSLTFNTNKTAIVNKPSPVSHGLVSVICVKTLVHDSINAFVEPLMPNNDFT